MTQNRRENSPDTYPNLILASASPRRAAILQEHGFNFTVVFPPEDDPSALPANLQPADFAEALSIQKANAVAQKLNDGLLLSGDTVAALGNEIFGKATDREDAERILRAVTAVTHQVITALTLLDAKTGRTMTRHATTAITMRELTDSEMSDYLSTNAWEGKAGAYGIQDHGDAFVEKIEGSFTNVVGLPIELLKEMLDGWIEESGFDATHKV